MVYLKVKNAEMNGAKGVILYSDPEDILDPRFAPDDVYPNAWWLPGWAVQRGSVRWDAQGDPLTPGWPAIGE